MASSTAVKTFKYVNIRGMEDDKYKLRRPNVFVGTGSEGVLQVGDQIIGINNHPAQGLSHQQAQNLFKCSGASATLDISRLGPFPASNTEMNVIGDDEQAQAKSVLSTHIKSLIDSDPTAANTSQLSQSQAPFYARSLPRGKPVMDPATTATNQKSGKPVQPMYCPIILEQQLSSPRGRDSYNTVPIENQPYRTLPLVSPNPKTIHDTGEVDRKYVASSIQKDQPYRSAGILMPGPRTINEAGRGAAPMYQPVRGPQYDTHITKQVPCQLYNNPRPLYSEENLADIQSNANYVQSTNLDLPPANQPMMSKPQESETFKIVLESEMEDATSQSGISGKSFEKSGLQNIPSRPTSQLSDRSAKQMQYEGGARNNNISQSTSFKRLMYSVLGGETEF